MVHSVWSPHITLSTNANKRTENNPDNNKKIRKKYTDKQKRSGNKKGKIIRKLHRIGESISNVLL